MEQPLKKDFINSESICETTPTIFPVDSSCKDSDDNNNNNVGSAQSPEHLKLLAKMEEANRLIESDSKSIGLTGSVSSSSPNNTTTASVVSDTAQQQRYDSRTSSFSSLRSSSTGGHQPNGHYHNHVLPDEVNIQHVDNDMALPRLLPYFNLRSPQDRIPPNVSSSSPFRNMKIFEALTRTKSSGIVPANAANGTPQSVNPAPHEPIFEPYSSTTSTFLGNSYLGEENTGQVWGDKNGQEDDDTAATGEEMGGAFTELVHHDTESSWETWSTILKDWENQSVKSMDIVRELVLKGGIPGPFRALAWQLMSGSVPLNISSATSMSLIKPVYAEYLKMDSPYEKLIRRDINRTYPEHRFFKEKDSAGQESLFNVMKAYSLYDQEVGYCQGSCFIVGMLLMQMPEEEAFAVLTKIMHKYNLRKMFKPSMSDLALCMYQLESMIQDYIPDLYRHFQENNFHASLYASPWFLTLFSSSLPLDTAFRIMDVFLLDGLDVIFKIAAAILYLSKADLLTLDMEGMLQYFQKDIPIRLGTDPDVIFHVAYHSASAFYNDKRMRKLEKDFNSIKVKEQDELVQIKKLRQENRLLKQRVTYLEQESASLADRLIQGQVSRAAQVEENFSVKRDFTELRKVLDDKDQSLKMALNQIQSLKETDLEKKETDLVAGKYDELITTLQQELLAVKYREAECLSNLDDLNKRYDILENQYRKIILENLNEDSVGMLKQELNSFKLKDLESSEIVKGLRSKLIELEGQVINYLSYLSYGNPENTFHERDKLPPLRVSLETPPHDQPIFDRSSQLHSNGTIPNGTTLKESSIYRNDLFDTEDGEGHSPDESPQSDVLYREIDTPAFNLEALSNTLCKKDRKTLANLIDALINFQLNDALSFASFKDLKLQLVELQAQLNSKIKANEYLNENLQYFKEKFDEYLNRDTDAQTKIKRFQWEVTDLKSQLQERELTIKLHETELMERSAEALGAASRLETQRTESLLNASLNVAAVSSGSQDLVRDGTRYENGDGGEFSSSCSVSPLLPSLSTTPSSLCSSTGASPLFDVPLVQNQYDMRSRENISDDTGATTISIPLKQPRFDSDNNHNELKSGKSFQKISLDPDVNNLPAIDQFEIENGNCENREIVRNGSTSSDLSTSEIANVTQAAENLINAPPSSDETDDIE